MAEYAARTKVPAERTRIEIEGLMRKRGADQFFSGGDSERILTIEDAFLADTVLPDRRTVAEVMLPQIETAYGSGNMPPLLPYYGGKE